MTVEAWRAPDRFVAATASGSAHLVDVPAGTYRRLSMSHELRHDGEDVRLLACSPPRLGRPLVLWLAGLAGPGSRTQRTTSEVVDVEHL